ncbi:MAG: ATP-binding protein [Rhodobacter sp.]|nr:ATP-binding protein [Rhodobacter sp.]
MTNEVLYNSVAPLRNVAALLELIERVLNRAPSLPGMACFYGPSGYGKTTAATFAENKYQAVRVQMKSTWTQKKLCEVISLEMGLTPARTVCDMIDEICEQLATLEVPLLIDEADYLVRRKMVEIARDIYEGSGAPVIFIGEELLPQKLSAWERVHGRMLAWTAAEPGDLEDLNHLAGIYAAGVEIGEDLKTALLRASSGSIRRICTNLDEVSTFAKTRGQDAVSLSDWQGREFFSGVAPSPRRFERLSG